MRAFSGRRLVNRHARHELAQRHRREKLRHFAFGGALGFVDFAKVIANDASFVVLVHREVNGAKRVREMIRRVGFSRLTGSVPAHGRHVALLIASKRRQHEVEPIVELPEKPAFNLPQLPHSRMRSAVAGWRREGAALSRHARTVTNAHTMGQNPGVEAAQGVVNGDAA